MAKQHTLDAYETKSYVAKRLGLTMRTLDRWKADPNNPFPKPVKIGNKDLYPRSEIIEHIRTQRANVKMRAA